MPNLPTLSVTQAQLDRITAAFPGTTTAEKVAAYQAWLINGLIDQVERAEGAVIDAAANADKAAKLAAMRASLPPRPPFPPA